MLCCGVAGCKVDKILPKKMQQKLGGKKTLEMTIKSENFFIFLEQHGIECTDHTTVKATATLNT